MASEDVWDQYGNSFTPATTSQQVHTLRPAVYRYERVMGGWKLELINDRFTFPYKIYGNHDHILNRVKKAWAGFEGNLGILLNGIKGTGKTVTAQLVANWGIDMGYPVLAVNHPIPLIEVMEKVHQPLVLLFDEYEKTHDNNDQQNLLTAIDGMSRSEHRRLFVFTTNERRINENLVDRPSRVRYAWEFGRMGEDLIEALMDDLLNPELSEFRKDILVYLSTRKVVSIDVAKTIINEVNLFRESPNAFDQLLNLTEQDIKSFTLEILDADGKVETVLSSWFTPSDIKGLRGILTKTGHREAAIRIVEQGPLGYASRWSSITLRLVGATDDPAVWLAQLRVYASDTWVKDYRKVEDRVYDKALWIDEKPEGWRIPSWAPKLEKGKEDLTSEEEDELDDWLSSGAVYGGDAKTWRTFRIRITSNFEEQPLSSNKNTPKASNWNDR